MWCEVHSAEMVLKDVCWRAFAWMQKADIPSVSIGEQMDGLKECRRYEAVVVSKVAIQLLNAAIGDKGPSPGYHMEVLKRHRKEWPALWTALDQVMELPDLKHTTQQP